MWFRRSLKAAVVMAAVAFAAMAGVVAAEADSDPSPYAGSWTGTWTIPQRGVEGTFTWTISKSGGISGSLVNLTAGRSGAIVGQVQVDGDLRMTGMVPDDRPRDGGNGYPFNGTAGIDGDGHLVLNLTSSDSDRLALVGNLQNN